MELNDIITFVAVASLLVISPGPNGVLIAKTVPTSGTKAGFANIWGFIGAFYLHGTLSIFGISLLLVQSAQAFFIFKMLGAAYLIWVGIKSLISAFKGGSASSTGLHLKKSNPIPMYTAFTEGFLTNALNPKVSMFYLAAFPQFISAGESVISAYALVSAHSAVNFVWFSLMILMLSRLKRATDNPSFRRWLNSITGVVFIGFGSKLALMKNS